MGLRPYLDPTRKHFLLANANSPPPQRSGWPTCPVSSYFAPKAISYTVGFRPSRTTFVAWTLFRLDSYGPCYRQSSRFYSFCALPRGCWCKGVLLYCCMAVENRLAALFVPRSPRAMRASRATNPRSSGLVALDFSRKPPKLRLWRCTQPRAAKTTAGVAVLGKMISRRALCCRRAIYPLLARGARNAPR